MKWSKILHAISALAGITGFLAMLVWWLVLLREGVDSFSPEHLYDDVVALLLLSIAFGIGTLIHQRIESSK